MIPPTFFRSVDLETNTLVEVAEALAGEGVPADSAAQYLVALSVSQGFSISLMFLEAEQKQGEVAREGLGKGKEGEVAGEEGRKGRCPVKGRGRGKEGVQKDE